MFIQVTNRLCREQQANMLSDFMAFEITIMLKQICDTDLPPILAVKFVALLRFMWSEHCARLHLNNSHLNGTLTGGSDLCQCDLCEF